MTILGFLRPKPTLTEEDVSRGMRMLLWEGSASMGMFSVTTSGLLTAYALALGANNLQIGLLAALPFLTQLLQVPGILLVERLRLRKLISVVNWTSAQLMWVPMALIPFFIGVPSQMAVLTLLALMALRGLPAALSNCSWNSWVRDVVPQDVLGRFFSRRLAWATLTAVVFGLGGAFFVDWWLSRSQFPEQATAYSYVLLAGALTLGLAGPLFLTRIPEPAMEPLLENQPSMWRLITNPLRDSNFRQLTYFLFPWGFAVNLAVPFFTVFMLQRLGFPIAVVIGLNILSQIAMLLFLQMWGPLTDRFGSKVVLSLSASLFVLTILGWTFTTLPDRHSLTVPLVVLLEIFVGVASAGVNLTTGTIGLKLAPQGQTTSYLTAATLANQLGVGLGPLVGGLLADFFSTKQLGLSLQWSDGGRISEIPIFDVIGMDFLFALAALTGLLVLNTLIKVREEGEVEREVVMEELLSPTRDLARTVGAIPGFRFAVGFPLSYLRRVPGVDVALGVTAYEVAALAKAAVTATNAGGAAAASLEDRVSKGVSEMLAQAGELGGSGVELARLSARGTLHAIDEIAEDVGELAKGALIGTVSAFRTLPEDPGEIIWAATYGTVQGADEVGADVGEAAVQAVEAAREISEDLPISEEEAMVQAAQGALAAAEAIGPETVAEVLEALPDDLSQTLTETLESSNSESSPGGSQS